KLEWGVYQSDHEDANAQFEINYKYADALVTADRFIFFKMLAGETARKYGAIATFMAKPFSDRTGSGAHMHYHLADADTGRYLAAGLDGIARRLDPGEPNLGNMYEMSLEEMARRQIRVLPQSLSEALDELERDAVIQAALGPIYAEFHKLKRMEWNDYHRQVS